jgi:transglutaminase-like putative cysteine protease
MDRRAFVAALSAAPVVIASPALRAQERAFTPTPGRWRTFEVVTRLEIAEARGVTQAWVPVPSVQAGWQRSLPSTWQGNMREAVLVADPVYGAQMVHARWDEGTTAPVVEVTSQVRTQDRAVDWAQAGAAPPANPAELALALESTELIPTGGIVGKTAQEATRGKRGNAEKVRAIYDWVVTNTHREPTVRGCGSGDIRAMLETGNLSGKCADINALFVGLCRAAGIPARDLYGIRVARSAFGYRELGAGGADISKAQHCRAEVWLDGYGWVGMDPADVGKVMRQETPQWLKDPSHPLVAPVNTALFGGWEGNWMAYNAAHDLALPGSRGRKVGFLMYPQAETRGERVDSLDPETFRYRITAREIPA